MDSLVADLRHAAHRLKSAPGFTAVFVITLGLGIAATTAIYSVIDALLLRPLPYRDPSRLVDLRAVNAGGLSSLSLPLTAERLVLWRTQTHVFEQVEAYRTRSATLAGGGEPQLLIGAEVTGGLFRMLGIPPLAGRTIDAGDAVPGSQNVVVISEPLWRARFAAAPDIAGQTVRLDDATYTIVGVMPERFTFPSGRRQFWMPLVIDTAPGARPVRANVTARVRSDLSVADAQERVSALSPGMIESGALEPGFSMQLTPPIARHLNTSVRRALFVLAGAVSLVLVIACANLANLLLVQGAGRAREMAIRRALGASRPRLVRQLLTETILLGTLGGLAGLLLAHWAIDLLAFYTPREMTFLNVHRIELDGRVTVFASVLTLLTSVVFGVLPALRSSGQAPNEALRNGRAATAPPRQERLRRGFVLAQVALSLVLLFAAGLMSRMFTHLTRIDPGFDPAGMVTVDLSLPRWKYPTRTSQQQFFDEVSARVRALPGARRTTLTGGVPPAGGGISFDLRFEIDGHGLVLNDPQLLMPFSEVDGDYFVTMGIPLRAGRTFAREDTPESPRVIVISEGMARRLWPDGKAVGDRIRFSADGAWYTVIGVAGDVYQFRHDQTQDRFAVYYPNSQSRGLPGQQTLVVRIEGDPRAALGAIRQVIWSVDADQPISGIRTVEDAYAEFFGTPRFYAFLMSSFALLGLVLSSVGLYGVLAHAVAQRTREFGIRTALGADRPQIMRLALRSGLVLTGTGILIGLAGSVAAGRALGALLVDISPTDAATYASTVAVLVAASLTACWIPARRATRVDPLVALRHE